MMDEAPLAAAVIARAMYDATGQDAHNLSPEAVADAWRFLTAESGPWAQSRATWADIAGTDADYIRRKALERTADHDRFMHAVNERSEARDEMRAEVRAKARIASLETAAGYNARRLEDAKQRTAEYARLAVQRIETFIAAGMPGPSVAELGSHLGCRTKQAAQSLMHRVAATGALAWTGRKSITWILPDGRQTLPSRPADRRRA